MTNETRNRIRAYMEELPHMKEKVFGALLMLVIAATVVVASSYAWVTLSRSPEVSDINTTLAANGALEIALSKPDGSMPDEFDIDESIVRDTNVTISNLQWGNLVNLSDASYGIDNLALRPAQLNDANLLYNPLWGATYGEDGRITELNINYTYTKYDGSQFIASKEYGVRAISSYTTTTSDSTAQMLNEKIRQVATEKEKVANQYNVVIEKFATLGQLISRVAQDKVNGTEYKPDSESTTDSNLASYLPAMRNLYVEVEKAMTQQKSAYAALANLQLYQWSKANDVEFNAITWADLESDYKNYNATNSSTPSKNGIISLTGLSSFVADYKALVTDLSYLEKYVAAFEADGAEYYWSHGGDANYQIVNMINRLINYGSMYLIIDGEKVPVGSLQSKAVDLVTSSNKDYDVYTQEGILQRFEQSVLSEGARMNGNAQCNISIKAKKFITITLDIKGHAYSTATGSSYFDLDLAATQNKSMDATDKVAEDTYGLAVDLWVRTNAEQTCLTLEGAIAVDEEGNVRQYEGTNRIWGDALKGYMSNYAQSTTQGGGSCYIYYADTPEDMARSLELLNAMKVAFVDSNGTLLATAEMDTVNYWAVNGRVTVPLVLDSQTKTTYTYTDAENRTLTGYAVTTLYTDMPIRVTAIVYLDGTRLTNDHVLAAAEIQGSLNIQFGSSVNLKTVGSNELIDDTRTVNATVSPEKLDYDKAKTEEDLTTTVTVNVEGADPTKVTAFFVRAINSTQGTREETMTFTKQANGMWTCDYLFKAPGTYWLRQVRLDGVDYTLADPQKVEVAGFALNSVRWSEQGDSVTVLTSDGSRSTTVTVQFASDDQSKMPAVVQARFVRDDGNTVNIPLTYNANGDWEGTGSFSASGVYQLQYLVADGRYIDLALNDGTYRTLDLSLGMYVVVEDLSGGLSQIYDPDKVKDNPEVYSKEVAVRVYNNADAELKELTGLRLFYSNGGSATALLNADLTWNGDALNGYYTGRLPITKPGRYMFFSVEMEGSNYLTKCDNYPTYVVISPYPPTYDPNSYCEENDDNGIQFIPLTLDGKISGIRTEHAESAKVSAVVYSAVMDSYYDAVVTNNGGALTIKLPTYNKQVGTDGNGDPIYEQSQDGVWSVAAIKLWDCYDGSSTELRTKDNPILWVDSGDVGRNWLSTLTDEDGNQITVNAEATPDFSALTTEVSGKVIVEMDAGTTALGSTDTPFGTAFQVGTATGMSVTVTDGAGRAIPREIDVTLTVSYAGNSTVTDDFKYVVNGTATYEIKLNGKADGEDPCVRKVSEVAVKTTSGDSDPFWKYVGVYTVNGLSVKIGDATYTGTIPGVPTQYTVKTAAPTAANVKLEKVYLGATTYGKNLMTGDVNGTFLQGHDMDSTYVQVVVASEDGYVKMNNAVFDELNVDLVLTHQSRSNETYGGYTFTGDPFSAAPFSGEYPNQTLDLNKNGAIYQASGSQILLAGVYTPKEVRVTVNGVTEATLLTEIMKAEDIKDITVWSMLPDVKITGVSITDEVTVSTNADSKTNHLTANNTETFKARNRFDEENGRWAVVYMAYTAHAVAVEHQESCPSLDEVGAYNSYADYTQPGIKFLLSNGGTGTADIKIDGIGNGLVELTNDKVSDFVLIGSIAEKTTGWIDQHRGAYYVNNCYYNYTYDAATPLGTVTIDEVTSTVGNATYYRTLENPLTISQPSQKDPTLTWRMTGVTIQVSDGMRVYSKTSNIPAFTPLTATVTVEEGYHDPELEAPAGVYDWQEDVSKRTETTRVYTFTMPLGNATLTGSATKYPAITFSKEVNNASVVVTVDGTVISSNTGAKKDATVVVTVTRTGNYCLPRMDKPAGITWTANEGDYQSIYTFKMPDAPVELNDPRTTQMVLVKWANTAKTDIFVTDVDENKTIGVETAVTNAFEGYVVPGHTLEITVVSDGDAGYINPTLKTPAGAVRDETSVTLTSATYEYEVPVAVSGNVIELTADAEGYPELIVGKPDVDYIGVTVAVKNADIPVDQNLLNSNGSVGIQPGNVVKVTLTPKAGYHSPRIDGADGWTVVNNADGSVEYTVTMPNDDVDIKGKIKATGATVTYNANGGSCGTASQIYAGNPLNHPTPTRTGYKFLGWYTAASGGTKVADGYTPPNADITLYAQWEQINYTITVSTSNATVTGVTNGQTAHYGDTISVTVSFTKEDARTLTVTDASGTSLLSKSANGTYSFTMPASNVTIKASSQDPTCITAGTMITMADGSQKAVEELVVGDMILVFNHITGELEAAPLIFNTHENEESKLYDVLHLQFSNGEDVGVVESHGFYDVTLMKYVYIDYENYGDYIGHQFYAGENEMVTLTNAFVETELTRIFCPVTYFHMNSFANGILNTPSIPGGITGLVNYFEYDEDLKYNEEAMQRDIEKYGLYTYEDFSDYISEAAYHSSPSVHLKVAVGKGMITYEDIIAVIKYLLAGSLID